MAWKSPKFQVLNLQRKTVNPVRPPFSSSLLQQQQGSGTARVVLVCSGGPCLRLVGGKGRRSSGSRNAFFPRASLLGSVLHQRPALSRLPSGDDRQHSLQTSHGRPGWRTTARRTRLRLGRAGNSLAAVTSVKPHSTAKQQHEVPATSVTQQQGAVGGFTTR